MKVAELGHRPEQPLELYEYEACPFCRRVRVVLSMLDLDVVIYSCPRGGQRFRPVAERLGGYQQFPYLVDPNSGVQMYESADIVDYLVATYGVGTLPDPPRSEFPACGLSRTLPSRAPAQPLELFGFETSPECAMVRDVLCELELPYLCRNAADGSGKRDELRDRCGIDEMPFLFDANTGKAIGGGSEISDYLEAEYAA